MGNLHDEILKTYCRVCFSTNKLKKISDYPISKHFFCIGDPKQRICKICRTKASAMLDDGKQFSDHFEDFGIKSKFFSQNIRKTVSLKLQ